MHSVRKVDRPLTPSRPHYIGACPKSAAISGAHRRPGPNEDWSEWQRQLRGEQPYQETQRSLLQMCAESQSSSSLRHDNQQQQQQQQHRMTQQQPKQMQQHEQQQQQQQYQMQQHLHLASRWQEGQAQWWPGYCVQPAQLVHVVPYATVATELQGALDHHGWLMSAQPPAQS